MTSLLAAAVLFSAPSGAQAAILTFNAGLDGASENPSNGSPAVGFASVVLDTVAHTISVNAQFSGLLSTTTAAHIHCCTDPPTNIGVAVTPVTLPLFPLGVTSGTYASAALNTLDAATYTAAFVTNFGGGTLEGAEQALIAGLIAGRAYFNIHTAAPLGFPGGEIRGFLQETPIPGALPLFASGLGALGFYGWRRRRKAHAA
ncbi:MAG TPA: CHRD domain-containing protein [Xanthobacteraceae bacterium]|nr:CHRD domain-containing protein [Xanthobacteraceae bacterium]